MKKFGLKAKFSTTGSRDLVKKQIDSGKPVPAGFLHHGPVSSPSGGGHWLCIIGYDNTGYWVNDPWGECDLLNGTYPTGSFLYILGPSNESNLYQFQISF